MQSTTIAVVEDEERIAGAVAARLRAEGFRVETAGSGPDGVELCRRIAPDLVVLDWMLPGFDGIEACRPIQADRPVPVPVLFLTARDAEADVLVGLGIGADDYITKPFSPRELVARATAILRRAARAGETTAAPRVVIGALTLALEGRRLLRDADEIRLTPTEFDLLATLASRPEHAFSRAELLHKVWDWRAGGSTRTVDSHVAGLRRKIGAPIVRVRARERRVSPLAQIPSLKLKLGLVIVVAIVVAIVVTLATMLIAAQLGLALRWGALVALIVSLVCVQEPRVRWASGPSTGGDK